MTLGHPRGRRRPTPGFTLLELLLAMSIFAAAAALVIPIAAGMLGDRELVRSGDQLRGELTRLRVHAIREGRVMMLQSNPESGELHVVPMFTAGDSTESTDSTGTMSSLLTGADQVMGTATPTGDPTAEGWTIELPEGIVVRSVVTSPLGGTSSIEAADLNATAVTASGGNTTLGSLPTVYFYPTGQTSNAIITLGNAGDEAPEGVDMTAIAVRVQVRGLTGDVTLRPNP
ncbi:prepilin-type N-terminal cleavage/methylation domain-containing protein [Rhodopirellula rubra]|uniref:Prepilin-type N-terminal cleavage/methylation domain-containing protein n=1 Tax=Aporhodopirellula rubra TaxID=980271 RepID=A0A7W5DUQ5_9BACT|nr:prepilin-type N-terminal cleavage/methylation domain-containing protein [Aporhodopirellula rubra]MBB3204710.1 prepilin-type N-terminal cleavage/methylation domain-containing protein [Aporhodopirellula rubra]